MIHLLVTAGHIIAAGFLTLFLLIVAIKVIWNIGLPYAMIREHSRGVHRAWSGFPLIEILPLLGAAGLALLLRSDHWISPGRLLLFGGLAIIGSYLHLVIVVMIYGLYRRRKGRPDLKSRIDG